MGGNTTEETKDKWYSKAKDYWTNQSASVDGMLGGYGHVSPQDATGSIKYIKDLKLDSTGVVTELSSSEDLLNNDTRSLRRLWMLARGLGELLKTCYYNASQKPIY